LDEIDDAECETMGRRPAQVPLGRSRLPLS
jgi:hypothetical protein